MSIYDKMPDREDFEVCSYSFDLLGIDDIYNLLKSILPNNYCIFNQFSLEKRIANEMVCASICHKINWDFLCHSIYKKSLQDIGWTDINRLIKIRTKDISIILSDYKSKEKIQAVNRSRILRSLSRYLILNCQDYTSIFFSNAELKSEEKVTEFLEGCEVFGHDPQQKKLQLLFQNLSDYSEFDGLNTWLKPTVDYHLIRSFLRRGLIKPCTQQGVDYIFKEGVAYEPSVATIRSKCSEAVCFISNLTGLDIKTVNRVEWWIGRSVCTENEPDCNLLGDASDWLKKRFDKCPFYESCYARKYNKNYLRIKAPNYKGSSY